MPQVLSTYEEDQILEQAAAITKRRESEFWSKGKDIDEAAMTGSRKFTNEELVYTAIGRCVCEHGLAYPKNSSPRGNWICGALLLSGERSKDVLQNHSPAYPFPMYSIKSEQQPSANGATTRPA